jgi:hypothetical protein
MAETGGQRGRIEEQPGKKAMKLHTEQQASPRRGNPPIVKTMLSRRQPERGGKAFWDTKQSDRHLQRIHVLVEQDGVAVVINNGDSGKIKQRSSQLSHFGDSS